ncbi:hypothetical protein RND81_03G130100 [Saponaria officinalis]|uniref:Secreted protein n=1 Tax=Saponaria officinalis TaxID=3572 RepID=A0AAW1M8J8_SAPOF
MVCCFISFCTLELMCMDGILSNIFMVPTLLIHTFTIAQLLVGNTCCAIRPNIGCAGSSVVEAYACQDTLRVPYKSKGKIGSKRAVFCFVVKSARSRVMFLSTFYSMRSDGFSVLCGPVIDDVRLLSI